MSVCPHCGSAENQCKIGTTRYGSQRWRCKVCHRDYTPERKPWGYTEAVKLEAIRLFVKLGNLRRVGALIGVSYVTVQRWIKRYGRTLLTRLEKYVLQVVDEIRRRHGGAPAPTTAIAAHLGRPERTVRLWLVRIERKGAVRRPSPKGGWLPV